MRKRMTLAALAALFSTGVLAGNVSFSELDQDDDGVITQSEAKGSKLEQKFQKADADGDKNISETEFDLYKQQKELKESGGGSSGGSSEGSSGGSSGGGGG